MGRIHALRLAFSIALAFTAFPRSVGAQCVILPLDDPAYQWADVAFVGTVQQVQVVPAGQIVTFAVERVYKGQVDEHVVVDSWQHPPVLEGIVTFELAKRYLVLPHRQSAEERQQFDLPVEGTKTLGFSGCDVYRVESSYVQIILRGAPGYPPRPSHR
jgi:hypothetical protein